VTGAVEIRFTMPAEHAAAFRAAIEEISEELGGRLQGSHNFMRDRSLTHAVIGMNACRAAVCRVVPRADPNYPTRWFFSRRPTVDED